MKKLLFISNITNSIPKFVLPSYYACEKMGLEFHLASNLNNFDYENNPYKDIVLHNIKSQYVDLTVAYFKMDGTSTNNSILYRKEQENYLKNLYGVEQYDIMLELTIYRKSRVITFYFKMYCFIMDHLSQQNFSRLLMLKRFVWRVLRRNVN